MCKYFFLLVLVASMAPRLSAATADSKKFATPREAVRALERALSARDLDALRDIFGPEIADLVNPDLVQATNEFRTVAAAVAQTNRLVAAGEKRMILEYGPEVTPFPVPLVQNDGKWFFDTAAGKEELINRRVGRNELAVLDVVRTYVQAQREYAASDRDEDQVLEYAQKFASTEGKKDGLYWPRDLDGTLSPLGPLVAEAQIAGYRKDASQERQAFHGYYFKILTRQGKRAPGGAYDYVINGNMIGGFALVAWPADYDDTGVMTFVVNQQGRVYQKDLGPNSGKLASSMTTYDPDNTWTASPD